MELLVISLDDAHERRRRLEDSLAPHNLSYHWVKAVDARGWSQDELASHCDETALFYNLSYDPIPGSVGCYLSHLRAFQHLIDSPHQAAIILEDDAELTSEFAVHLPALEQVADNIDVIFLCDRRPKRPSVIVGTTSSGLSLCFKKYANIGANGYVIHRTAAAKILSDYQKFGLEIDTLLNRWWVTGLNVATTSPELVTHVDMGSHIGYDNIVKKRSFLQKGAHGILNLKHSVVKRVRFSRHARHMKQALQKAIS